MRCNRAYYAPLSRLVSIILSFGKCSFVRCPTRLILSSYPTLSINLLHRFLPPQVFCTTFWPMNLTPCLFLIPYSGSSSPLIPHYLIPILILQICTFWPRSYSKKIYFLLHTYADIIWAHPQTPTLGASRFFYAEKNREKMGI